MVPLFCFSDSDFVDFLQVHLDSLSATGIHDSSIFLNILISCENFLDSRCAMYLRDFFFLIRRLIYLCVVSVEHFHCSNHIHVFLF